MSMALLQQLISTLLDGANFAMIVLGVAWAFRVSRFPDLTGDGSFVLGAFLSAIFCRPEAFGGAYLGLLSAAVAGALAGVVCGILNSRLQIPNLLCGILVMLGLYSLNLRLLGKPNEGVDIQNGIFAIAFSSTPLNRDITLFTIILGIVLLAGGLLVVFMQTSPGLRFRAAASNPEAAKRLGISPEISLFAGLAIANMLIALGGAIYAQRSGFVDIRMGFGIVIFALAALLLGEAIMGRRYSMTSIAIASLTGAIIYRIIIAIALRMGFNPYDLNIITVAILIMALGLFSQRIKNGLARDVRV